MAERDYDEHTQKIAISEGADICGSDGERYGRVVAVGAHYLTVVGGFLGQQEWFLPIGLVAQSTLERIELTIPLEEAKARAHLTLPANEPTNGVDGEPISEAGREAAGIPEPKRADWGLGESRRDHAR